MKKQLILTLHTFHRNSQRHYIKPTMMMSISVIGDWYDDDDGYDVTCDSLTCKWIPWYWLNRYRSRTQSIRKKSIHTKSTRRKSICNSKDSTGKQGHIASKGLLKYSYYPWDWIESSQLKRNVLQTHLSPRWTTNLEPFWVLLGFVQTHDDLVSRFV